MTRFIYQMVIAACILTGAHGLAVFGVDAATVSEIREEINARNAQIEALEEEIAEYRDRLNVLGERKQTLETTIETLDISRQKLAADIQLTQERINAATLEIQELQSEITTKEDRIEQNREAIGVSLRTIAEQDDQTLVEALLANDSLNAFWNAVEDLQRFQVQLQREVADLQDLKETLEQAKQEQEGKRTELVSLRNEIAAQKGALDDARNQEAQLLAQTESREENFQSILQEKQRQKEAFQQELFSLESQLEVALDPDRIPSTGAGILAWPVPDPAPVSCWEGGAGVQNCLTQFFGKTSDSGRLYASGTHNGIDFRAVTGTKVSAALSGVVKGVGNTDQYPGCYSYGKWVLIEHNNGLSTMYAHLSSIGVSNGQSVRTGDFIGYSGNTGYSTGPHLHFTVYATQGVQVVRLGDYKSITNCPNARIPVAPRDAYLDPLSYL